MLILSADIIAFAYVGIFRPPGTLVPKAFCFSRDVFLPAPRYASAGYRDRNVSVCPSVRPSRAGIVSKRRMLAA